MNNLRSKGFGQFFCIGWTLLKSVPMVALIYYWEYGIYPVIIYMIYRIEKQEFSQFRMIEETNNALNEISNQK